MNTVRLSLAASTVLVLALAGCGSEVETDTSEAPSGSAESSVAESPAADFPRTVDVHGEDVEIPAEPQRIVALSTETGDLALELVGPDRIAAVSTGSVTPGAGNQIELAESVETVFEASTTPDPEQILSLEPDLVLITERHDGEQDAADLLQGTGVPSIVFESADFQSLDAIADSVALLGDALGADDAAAGIVADFQERRASVDAEIPDDDSPRVMLLMARGGQQMLQPASSLLAHLVAEAGGEVVGSGPGATPADPERIVEVDPDVILVEDFRGAGLGPFQELLNGPALSDVRAVSDDQVHLVSGSVASDAAGTAAVAGLEEVADLIR